MIDILLILVPVMPLVACLVVAVLGARVLRGQSHLVVIGALIGSFVCSVMLIGEMNADRSRQRRVMQDEPIRGYERIVTLWRWAEVADAYTESGAAAPAGAPGEEEGGGVANVVAAGEGGFQIDVALRLDSLTLTMLCMVTFVSTLVAVFAAGYMKGDPGYWRFFTYLSLFVFSMTMLVSVSNFLLLYVFWEAVGVCSYLLIGFWYNRPEAAAAGKKAFLVNRVGDFGFALGVFLIWTTYGTLNFHDSTLDGSTDTTLTVAAATVEDAGASGGLVEGVLGRWRIARDHYVTGGVALAISLLLLLGACGKSAQFPLHVWLPDAMEGPTPVSALIHAATMVTAGVYLIARCTPLFAAAPVAQMTVAAVGAGTALLAALIALTQHDLKRVLAYSTISQLGYMFLALGCGSLIGITAAMFHLFTHAFFKALLFLGSGSVMHAMGNVIDMRRFGGLRQRMPVTCWTFLFGCLALAGIVPFAGFWSKDAVLAAVHERAYAGHGEHAAHDEGEAAGGEGEDRGLPEFDPEPTMAAAPIALRDTAEEGYFRVLYLVALFTALLTAFYTFRAFYLTFAGEERIPAEAAGHAHESPPMMTVPLVILAVAALLVGMFFMWTRPLGDFLIQTPSLAGGAVAVEGLSHEFHLDIAATSTIVALLGVGLASFFYLGDRKEIAWIKARLDFEDLRQFADVSALEALQRRPWVQAVYRRCDAWGIGWLARLLGLLALIPLWMLSVPFALGRFLTPYQLSSRKFYFDEIYAVTVVLPLRLLARFSAALDRILVDGIVNAVGWLPKTLGGVFRKMQTGLIPFYALAGMVLLTVVLVVVFLMQFVREAGLLAGG